MTDQRVPDGHDHEAVYPAGPVRPGAPVDPPDRPVTIAAIMSRAEPTRPIVPASLRTAAQRRQLADWFVRYSGHRALYHLTRLPKYAAKVTWWAPVGVLRTLARVLHWASAEEGNWALRQEAATRNDPATWLALDARRQRQASWRWPLIAAVTGCAVVAAVVFTLLTPGWLHLVALLAAVVVLARLGRPLDRPIVDRVTAAQPYRKLTAEMTRRAILATGKVKRAEDIKFVTGDIHRDGPGYLAIADLPDGVVGLDIIDERPRLAGGFRLPVDQVWPETVRGEHPSRLRIWVADQPVSVMRQPGWPLLNEGTVDYFQPFPYGADVRLRPVSWRLDERNSLFGGVPGSGKSLAARLVMLGAVLDPLVIPVISELKGSGDYDMFEPLCPRGLYVCGADEGAIKRTVAIIEWLHQLCEERGPLIAKYARQGMNNVKKVNRVMAEHDERLRPVVAMFDEIQEFMSSEYGIKGGGAQMLLSAIKRARALGIHVIVATQRFDKDSMPKAISSLVTNRAALAVPAQPETDMILGTSAYRTGARPNAFVPGEDSGWMVRAGFSAGYETIRSALVDDNAATHVIQRALALRGEAPEVELAARVPAYNLLEDVEAVWPVGEDKAWSVTILAALAVLRPDIYTGWSTDQLAKALKPYRVKTGQVWATGPDGERGNKRGIERSALKEAIAARRASELTPTGADSLGGDE